MQQHPRKFYKLLADDLCHNGFRYKEGLNVDTVPFRPEGQCFPGGLYYTDLEYLPKWYKDEWPLIADVILPADALVYPEPCGTKWKADRFELKNIRPLREFFAAFDEPTISALVEQCVYLLQHVPQTEALCLVAVQKDGAALHRVHNKTDALCLAAVKSNGFAIHYVVNKTEAICLAAVEHDPWTLEHMDADFQTDAVCLAAVQRSMLALYYVKNQTEALCLAAVKLRGRALGYVRVQTEAICLAAVQQDGLALDTVHKQTDAICLAAVQQNGYALKYVHIQTAAICHAAMTQSPDAVVFVNIRL